MKKEKTGRFVDGMSYMLFVLGAIWASVWIIKVLGGELYEPYGIYSSVTTFGAFTRAFLGISLSSVSLSDIVYRSIDKILYSKE